MRTNHILIGLMSIQIGMLAAFGALGMRIANEPILIFYDQDRDLLRSIKSNRRNSLKKVVPLALLRAMKVPLGAFPYDGEMPREELDELLAKNFNPDLHKKIREMRVRFPAMGKDERPYLEMEMEDFKSQAVRGRIQFRTIVDRFDEYGKKVQFLVTGFCVLASPVEANNSGIFFDSMNIERI